MSIIQVQSGGGRVISDRTSFVGVRVPSEIKTMVKKLNKLDKDIYRQLLNRKYSLKKKILRYNLSKFKVKLWCTTY